MAGSLGWWHDFLPPHTTVRWLCYVCMYVVVSPAYCLCVPIIFGKNMRVATLNHRRTTTAASGIQEEDLKVSMAEASTKKKNRTFHFTIRCSNRRFGKFVKEFANIFTNDMKQKSCCECVKDEKRDREGANTHKSEAYVKTEVDKNVCRDIFCKTHVDKPIFLSSSADNLPRPPLFQPHKRRSYHTVYPPPPSPPLFRPHNRRWSYHTVYPPPPSPPLLDVYGYHPMPSYDYPFYI
ncbi:unnamed protein product [Lactuca saligna]|uniref:Uncharacterized protein n=1 Tax=Lactuca saligna TaxID=75948 RepID=A0AA36E5Q2_LACSI|nr:unnamed protein product [Lactuca saligna]